MDEKEIEKHGEDPQIVRRKKCRPGEKGNELNATDESKPQEAWIPINTEPDRIDIMKKLLTIGKYTSERSKSSLLFSRKECDAPGCTCCIRHLHLRCDGLLFWLTVFLLLGVIAVKDISKV